MSLLAMLVCGAVATTVSHLAHRPSAAHAVLQLLALGSTAWALVALRSGSAERVLRLYAVALWCVFAAGHLMTAQLESPLLHALVIPVGIAALYGHRRDPWLLAGATVTLALTPLLTRALGHAFVRSIEFSPTSALAVDLTVLVVVGASARAVVQQRDAAERQARLHAEALGQKHRELERHAEHDLALAALSQELLAAADTHDVLRRGLLSATLALGVDHGAVLRRSDQGTLHLASSVGWLLADGAGLPVSEVWDAGPLLSLSTRSPVVFDELPPALADALDGLLSDCHPRAGLSIPIPSSKGAEHVLWLCTAGVHVHRADDIALAASIGGAMGLAVDRTEAFAALRQRSLELSRSNSDLAAFAHVVSHDLKEPLRMVNRFGELLARHGDAQLGEEARSYVRFMVDGAARMRQLVDGLLTYSRVGGCSLDPGGVDMARLTEELLTDLQVTIDDAQCQVVVDPLPALRGDRTQLRQLLQNLLVNAIKFRSARACRVRLSASHEAGHWHFQVRDNGIGIAPDQVERIFGIFQRLHTREEYDGTGLGLALCRKIVQRHGGSIWCESTPGEGSVFHFLLPTSETDAAASAQTDDEHIELAAGHRAAPHEGQLATATTVSPRSVTHRLEEGA